MEARIRAIQGMGRVLMIVCSLSLGFVVVATAFPQQRELERLEEKLAEAKEKQEEVMEERDCRQIELNALREDPAYLELHARDRLGYYLPGERVLKFKKE
ncbi:MAG: septum formation initiator family protein [Akkermansiaceae bacterium]|nr:septum formation initiator family protein [Akkermansiaceae bacterium]